MSLSESAPKESEPAPKESEEQKDADRENLSFPNPSDILTGIALFFYPAIVALSLPFFYWQEGVLFPFRYLSGKMPLTWQIILGFLVGGSFIVLSILGRYCFDSVRNAEYDLKEVLGYPSWRQIMVISICSAMGEEIIFRGLLQPTLGIWITSILFGLVHPPLSKNLFFYPFVAAGIGWVLGWLFITTGGLLAPSLAHFFINAVNLYRITRLPSISEGLQNTVD